MRKLATVAGALLLSLALVSPVWAYPGMLQIASRDGFFANDYPAGPMFLQHFYTYWADTYVDGDGNSTSIPDLKIQMLIERLIGVWRFGDRSQWQLILELIGIYQDVSSDLNDEPHGSSFPKPLQAYVGGARDTSGFADPYTYFSFGWNNPQKTTHLTAAVIIGYPVGDSDLEYLNEPYGGNAYRVEPVIAWEQRFGPNNAIWSDLSFGYMHWFDDLTYRDSHGRDYWEINEVLSYHLTDPYFSRSWSVYFQLNYKDTQESEWYDEDMDDDGYNLAVGGGVGCWVSPKIQVNLKYANDIDGENEFQGYAFNLRVLIFL